MQSWPNIILRNVQIYFCVALKPIGNFQKVWVHHRNQGSPRKILRANIASLFVLPLGFFCNWKGFESARQEIFRERQCELLLNLFLSVHCCFHLLFFLSACRVLRSPAWFLSFFVVSASWHFFRRCTFRPTRCVTPGCSLVFTVFFFLEFWDYWPIDEFHECTDMQIDAAFKVIVSVHMCIFGSSLCHVCHRLLISEKIDFRECQDFLGTRKMLVICFFMEVVISPNTWLPKKLHFIYGIVSVLVSSLAGGRSVLFFLCLGVLYWLLPSLICASSLYLHKFFQLLKRIATPSCPLCP